jgi:hypothetical protein
VFQCNFDLLSGVVAAACVGLMVVLITILIVLNVSHWYNANRRQTHHITFHDIELSQFSKHMTVIVNPMEEQVSCLQLCYIFSILPVQFGFYRESLNFYWKALLVTQGCNVAVYLNDSDDHFLIV